MGVYEVGWRIGDLYGCKLVCHEDSALEGGVYLSILHCYKKGSGARCLEDFISTMQTQGFSRIRLDAYPMDYPLGYAPEDAVRSLVHWYERFGFRLTGDLQIEAHNEMILTLTTSQTPIMVEA